MIAQPPVMLEIEAADAAKMKTLAQRRGMSDLSAYVRFLVAQDERAPVQTRQDLIDQYGFDEHEDEEVLGWIEEEIARTGKPWRPLTGEELLRIGTMPPGTRPSEELINEDRGEY